MIRDYDDISKGSKARFHNHLKRQGVVIPKESKQCDHCDTTFFRKKESNAHWRLRECCNRSCIRKRYQKIVKERRAKILEDKTVIRAGLDSRKFTWTDPLDKWLYGYKAA